MLSKNKAKYIQQLHLKKNREAEGLFLAEGKKLVSEIIGSEYKIEELFASEDYIAEHQGRIRQKKISFTAITQEELKKISTLNQPDDVLAICRMREITTDFASLKDDLCVYLDGIRDPGNMGTIIRVCDWFGIKNIFCSGDTTELYNPKTIQASMGSFLRVNVSYFSLEEIWNKLKTEKIALPVYGAYMKGENLFELKTFAPGILIIGNEANGISDVAGQFVDKKIAIPSFSANGPESLNAAVAASIIIAEFRRING